MKTHSLRFKITLTVMSIVVLLLLATGTVYFISISRISARFIQSNERLSEISGIRSSASTQELIQERLQDISTGKAGTADNIFLQFEQAVETAATAAKRIYENPSDYSPRPVEPPDAENDGRLSLQVLYATGVDPSAPAIRDEMMLLGNIQDTLYAINLNSPSIASNYIATESGIMIQADYIAGSKFNEAGRILSLDAKSRPWYFGAVSRGAAYFTPITRDLHTPNLAIMCGVPIFVDGNLKGVAGAGMYLNDIDALVQGIDLGESGDACIINQAGQVLFTTFTEGSLTINMARKELRESDNKALAALVTDALTGGHGVQLLELDGTNRYVAYSPLKTIGWSLLVVLSQDEVETPTRELLKDLALISEEAIEENSFQRTKTLLILLGILFVTILIALAASFFLSKRIVAPIQELTDEVAQVEGDNLDFHWNRNTGDETQLLATSFQSLTERMKAYINDIQVITAERERIGTELSLATRIQADMLPNAFPPFPERKDFDMYASMTPAKEVGGDFYDFFLLDETHLALVIADVSGKGVPAALFMMVSMLLIRNILTDGLGPAEALKKLNDQICAGNREDMFVTVWLGILDLSSGQLRAANAGHEFPVLKKPGAPFELVKDPHGFVIGGLPDMNYREYEWQLEPGSKLFVYTDGVPEANISPRELFGMDRLMEVLRTVGEENPKEILAAVEQAVDAFMGDAPRFDDLTMLCVEYKGKEQ